MKKTIIALLLVLLTIGLCVSCNGNVYENMFDSAYKIQADGSWVMGKQVFPQTTKPYLLSLPKSLNPSAGLQQADLEEYLVPLTEITSATETNLGGSATIKLETDANGVEFYNYKNTDSTDTRCIFMRTKDDYTETILLNSPYDEFSHYGSLNIATVDSIAPESYYEYGYVRKIILSLGHLVAEQPSRIGCIIVSSSNIPDVTVDIKSEEVKAVLVPEGFESVVKSKPATVTIATGTDTYKFVDSEGKLYSSFGDLTNGSSVTLIDEYTNNVDVVTGKNITLDLYGSTISGQMSIENGSTLTIKDSLGTGKVENTPTVNGTLIIEGGLYKFDPTAYVDSAKYSVLNVGTYFKVSEKKMTGNFTGLCFTAVESDSTVKLKKIGNPETISLKYSTDGITWNNYSIDQVITLANIGDTVSFKAGEGGNDHFSKDDWSNYYNFEMSGKIAASGNIMSLLDPTCKLTNLSDTNYKGCFLYLFYNCSSLITAPELPATTLVANCYNEMFKGCTSLTTAPVLPATTLAYYCYGEMFRNCSSLTTAPALSVTTLAEGCYSGMFKGCTSLTKAPVLPATTLTTSCYSNMFCDCSSLTEAPVLPATTLADNCYWGMFDCCTSLTNAPALPATTLTDYCYIWMFSGCSGLTTAPALPATTLAQYCYDTMFGGCTGLTTAPALPATNLANGCYRTMFQSCTNLVNAPALSATNLAHACYYEMFKGCTSLTNAPVLPATNLATNCYTGMFSGCTSLTDAPALPATTLTIDCYKEMFSGCTSLTASPVLPAKSLAVSDCYKKMFAGCTSLSYVTAYAYQSFDGSSSVDWLKDVASTGTFTFTNHTIVEKYQSGTMTDGSASTIPNGWTVVNPPATN